MSTFQTYREMSEGYATRPESAADLSVEAHKFSGRAYSPDRDRRGHSEEAKQVAHELAHNAHDAARIGHELRAETSEGSKKEYHTLLAMHHAQMAEHHKKLGRPKTK